jgi:hypothetical protein
LLQRNIDDVHFQFDDKEEAYRGCAKLKQVHDKVSAGIVKNRQSKFLMMMSLLLAMRVAVLHDVVSNSFLPQSPMARRPTKTMPTWPPR